MVFSSITFLYYFLPITLLAYYLFPRKYRNYILLTASFVFYGWGEPRYLLCMVLSIAVGYVFSRGIDVCERQNAKRRILIFSLLIHFGMLFYFKYMNFFLGNWMMLPSIALPIGISFYTFQITGYLIDVYRGDVTSQKNILSFAMYVSMFPQLIAGPIVRYSDVEKQIVERDYSYEKIREGTCRFVVGLAKKVLLADRFGELCYIFRDAQEPSVLYVWVYALAFFFQVYFDFSGYSDMAIGLGKIFGFDFMENFSYPYCAKTITEFWRKWHISLGSWFRDYVYIPLGGNRCGQWRQMVNILLVWCLTGFWHGAEWNFLLWGLFYGILLILEKITKMKRGNRFYMLFFVIVGFVIFDAANMQEAVYHLKSMFGLTGLSLVNAEALYYFKSYIPYFVIGGICSTPFLKRWSQNAILVFVLFLFSTGTILAGSFQPFLYFRF